MSLTNTGRRAFAHPHGRKSPIMSDIRRAMTGRGGDIMEIGPVWRYRFGYVGRSQWLGPLEWPGGFPCSGASLRGR